MPTEEHKSRQLDAANTVIELLMQFFPTTLDPLKPEAGHFRGPPPALQHDPPPHKMCFPKASVQWR